MYINTKAKTILMVILTILLTLIIVNVVAEPALKWQAENLKTFSGTLKVKNGQYSLQYGKDLDILNIAPPAALDSLELHPAEADTVSVTGIESKGSIICSAITWKGKTYMLRDATGKPIWKGLSTWVNNPKTCIGCRLCFMNCPADAITMVGNKAVIDQTKCTGCNICIAGNGANFKGCPVKSISK